MIAIAPVVAAVLGMLVYVLASNAKAAEIGRTFMWCGILVTLLVLAQHPVRWF